MKVFSQLFVALRNQVVTTYHFDESGKICYESDVTDDLGFATPVENENAADMKRRKTAISWAKESQPIIKNGAPKNVGENGTVQWDRVKEARHKIIDNVPRSGFKIVDSVKRKYWGGGNVVFRIRDPEGFELEIQSQNLMMLIANTQIENGVIGGKCIWGRDGAHNILLHETSEEYKSAIKNAETAKPLKAGKINGWKPGDHVKLTSNISGVYLGKFCAHSFEDVYVEDERFSNNNTGYSKYQNYLIGKIEAGDGKIRLVNQNAAQIKNRGFYHFVFVESQNYIVAYRELKVLSIISHAEKEIDASEAQALIESKPIKTASSSDYFTISLVRKKSYDIKLGIEKMSEEDFGKMLEFINNEISRDVLRTYGMRIGRNFHKNYPKSDFGLSPHIPLFVIKDGESIFSTWNSGEFVNVNGFGSSYSVRHEHLIDGNPYAIECKLVDGKLLHYGIYTPLDVSMYHGRVVETLKPYIFHKVKNHDDVIKAYTDMYNSSKLYSVVLVEE